MLAEAIRLEGWDFLGIGLKNALYGILFERGSGGLAGSRQVATPNEESPGVTGRSGEWPSLASGLGKIDS